METSEYNLSAPGCSFGHLGFREYLVSFRLRSSFQGLMFLSEIPGPVHAYLIESLLYHQKITFCSSGMVSQTYW